MKRPGKRAALIALLAALLLGALVLWLPSLVRSKVNGTLAHMPGGYHGSIEDVTFRPLMLAVELEGLRIEKADGSVKTPFMVTDALRVRLVKGRGFWPELELSMLSPRMSWIDADDPRRQQWGPNIDLADLKKQLGLQLMRARIVDGELHFRNYSAKPQVDVYASHVNVTFDQLTDCLPPAGFCDARLVGEGRPLGDGKLELEGKLEHDKNSRFELVAALGNLDLPRLNPALLHYADVDVKSGRALVRATVHMKDDAYRVALRPSLKNVEVMGGSSPDRKVFREMAVGMATHYLEKRSGKVVLSLSGQKGKAVDFDLDVDRDG